MKDKCRFRIKDCGEVMVCDIDGDKCIKLEHKYCPLWELVPMICPCHKDGCGCTETEVYVSKELETIYCPVCCHSDDLPGTKGEKAK